MRQSAFHALAAAVCAVLSGAAVVRWHDAAPSASAPVATVPPIAPTFADSLDEALASAEESIVSNDPFRLANIPAAVRYDPGDELALSASGVSQLAPLRPTITLKAIVGGPPWQAVVDGLPGQPANTVVQAGSRYDKLVARSVTRDSVVIQGPDTTWVLSFRRPE
ncbi:MAG TPA: hypothetical protein VL524_02455 [Gemmatimonadaceae bacterium]|nr:hypothetical protein [Gemmatimonadaceae bacterium]